ASTKALTTSFLPFGLLHHNRLHPRSFKVLQAIVQGNRNFPHRRHHRRCSPVRTFLIPHYCRGTAGLPSLQGQRCPNREIGGGEISKNGCGEASVQAPATAVTEISAGSHVH